MHLLRDCNIWPPGDVLSWGVPAARLALPTRWPDRAIAIDGIADFDSTCRNGDSDLLELLILKNGVLDKQRERQVPRTTLVPHAGGARWLRPGMG